MNSGNISSPSDSSSDEEDCRIYSRVGEALAANRLKAARENAERRLNKEVGPSTSSSGKKPEEKKKRKGRTKCHENDNIICISPEQKKELLSLVTVYGFCEGEGRVFTFNISRTEPLNVLRNHLAQQVDAPACSVRLSLQGKLLNGYESLDEIEAGETVCMEFEIDEVIKEALQNVFKLRFVFQKRPAVVLDVDKTAEFRTIIGELCERCKMDSSKLAVFFDGERVCETDTPSSLGMESEDAVDVILKD